MCGIWACFSNCSETQIKKCTRTLIPRGPETIRHHSISPTIHFGFTRLAINGLNQDGMQPMTSEQGQYTWICNGEIYNWRELKQEFNLTTSSDSDCSIIGPLFAKFSTTPELFFQLLDGVFAIIIYDASSNTVTIGRDPYGVRPLYYTRSRDIIAYASEIKALLPLFHPETNNYIQTDTLQLPIFPFPPGTYQSYALSNPLPPPHPTPYHQIPFLKNPATSNEEIATDLLRKALTDAVRKRVQTTERPIAALLSGGIDSSLIAALVQQELIALNKPPLETYSIGFEGSSDLFYARKVAAHIGSKHTEIIATPEEFFQAIPEVIRTIESYDITTVRASVGNYLVAKYIASHSNAKVIFNGDGSDEVFGSYLYFFRAPTSSSFEQECRRLLKDIHLYDVLRSDRSISANGLEPRTPFLDRQFVQVALSIVSSLRQPSNAPSTPQPEKYILRKAFESTNLLPNEVLWRRKEAFSDGVSGKTKAWYEEIRDRVPTISQENQSLQQITHNPPQTPEAKYYRRLFTSYYPSCSHIIPYFWMPKWSGETADPSAKTLSIY